MLRPFSRVFPPGADNRLAVVLSFLRLCRSHLPPPCPPLHTFLRVGGASAAPRLRACPADPLVPPASLWAGRLPALLICPPRAVLSPRESPFPPSWARRLPYWFSPLFWLSMFTSSFCRNDNFSSSCIMLEYLALSFD